jgi:predicted enzyme related to lactoylglutathione lyase
MAALPNNILRTGCSYFTSDFIQSSLSMVAALGGKLLCGIWEFKQGTGIESFCDETGQQIGQRS